MNLMKRSYHNNRRNSALRDCVVNVCVIGKFCVTAFCIFRTSEGKVMAKAVGLGYLYEQMNRCKAGDLCIQNRLVMKFNRYMVFHSHKGSKMVNNDQLMMAEQ